MMRLNSTRALVALSALAALAPLAEAKKPEKGASYLVRPDAAPDPDARGTIQVTQKGVDEEIRFDAKKLDPAESFEVYLEDSPGAGTFMLFGTMSKDGDKGAFKLRVRSKDGPLPLAATSVDDYADRAVEVRVVGAGDVVLEGLVPLAVKLKGKKGFEKKKAGLALPVTPPDENAKGRVEVWHKIKDNRERFRVRAEKLSASDTYKVFVEDAVGSGIFVEVGDMKKDGGKGEKSEFKLHLDSKNGDPMPAGADFASDLGDRVVQVRNGADAVVLEGTIPALD